MVKYISSLLSSINRIRRVIEVVITGLTRNFLSVWRYAPLKFPVSTEFLLGSKIKYFVVLSVSSCEKFFKRKRNYIHGELSEWSKVQHSKSCFHFGSPNCRKASNHAGLRASSNCELGSVLSCCSSQFPRLEFCGKMAIMRAAI